MSATKISLPVINLEGKALASMEGNAAVFGAEPNEAVVHFVCEGQRFRYRQPNACTKTRSAVNGGGKKARPQKGSGGSRQGGNRAPHWVGGGAAFGPSAILRDFKVNRKMRKTALVSILSDRYSGGQIRVLKGDLKAPKTQTVTALLKTLELRDARVGFAVAKGEDASLAKSARNIRNVDVLAEEKWTCLDFIKTDTLILTEAAYQGLMKQLGGDA